MIEETEMFDKMKTVAAENPSLPNQQSSNQGMKHFGKKRYAVIAAAAAIVIIAAAFFIPQGGAIIPLNVDFVVGEKMVYDNTFTISLQGISGPSAVNRPNTTTTTSMNSEQTIEVLGFDGENYLLNHTITMTILGKSVNYSMTEKMNKTGYSTYLLNVGQSQTEIPNSSPTSTSYLAQLLNQPEAKIGDTINIPYPTTNLTNSSTIQTTGNLTIKFNAPEDLTVPAGTYKVFRIDMASNNLKMTLALPATNSSTITPNNISANIDLNAQIYLEYGTLRQIKSTMEETSSYQSSIMNMTLQMASDMTLKEHIKP
jgi:hypothetical protein